MSTRRYTVAIDDRSFTIDVFETAADRFVVSVDGRTFEATLEGDHDLPGAAISPQVVPPDVRAAAEPPPERGPTAPEAPPAASRPPPAAPRTSTSRDTAATALTAPMPGVVLELLVAPGTVVRRGDAVLVLEAMKMRNTIRTPRDAIVDKIAVTAGQPVGPGDLLVSLRGAPP